MDNPIIYDTSDGQQLRINMISPWLKRYFTEHGEGNSRNPDKTLKVVKLSLDGGFTCPNRDGTKGIGGCLFCSESGSGDMASSIGASHDGDAGHVNSDNIATAIKSQIKLISGKWPPEKYNLKFMAYFQSHTNTYAPADKLRNLFEAALSVEGICGLAIATRPDCISEEVIRLLEELNHKTFLWVELGLQTIHDSTAKAMNLCHTVHDYDQAASELMKRNIRVVTHLILGLPGESRKMMLESVRHACRKMETDEAAVVASKATDTEISACNRIFGLKLHMLNVVRGSGMAKEYGDYVPFETMEEYIELLIEALEIVPPGITMHRISGDAPRSTLIAPAWSYRKRTILNSIHNEMRKQNTWQGRKSPETSNEPIPV